jgi:hypothetical protein
MVGSGIDSGEKAEGRKILCQFGRESGREKNSVSIRERKQKGRKFCCRFGSSRFGSVPVWYETGHFQAETPESYGKNSRMSIRVQKFTPVSADTVRNEQFFVDTGDFGRRYGSLAHIVQRPRFCST